MKIALALSITLSFLHSISLQKATTTAPRLAFALHLCYTASYELFTKNVQFFFHFLYAIFTPFLSIIVVKNLKKKESNRISNAYLFKKLLLAMQFNISIFSSEDQSIIKGYLKAKIFFSYYSCICFFFFFFFRSDKFEEMGFASFWFHALLS